MYTDLLQTENECLGTLNLVDLPSFTHSLLDDVTIIIIILQRKENYKDIKNYLCIRELINMSLMSLSEWLRGTINDKSLTNPHVLFEDVCSSLHFNHTVDDQFTVGSQEVSPLVQSFYLYCLIILLPIWDDRKKMCKLYTAVLQAAYWLIWKPFF